ncbi:T9SS type A sorting domain-containing protein [Hymenobacter edaphi]|uniref:Secretion system C-terminal sorting domain-containing protein n=1 Tax=Hymenobacter edaphi TaxID=2211146 RepID=A0A328BQ81_9BACT|nr:T9SS type A sorting domain-containing protein [Hymenobacter edaphi]RAK68166.1 hypothetical protein DLM85_09010 [Hymenobacter edaphi]
MGKLLPLLAVVLATTASAQTLDRTFQPVGVYAPAGIQYALQLTDGSRVFAGGIIRGEGQPVGGLFRYTPAGQPDNTFNANARVSIAQAQGGDFMQLAEAPGGKLVVMFWASIIRLNADGTRDQGFPTLSIGSYAPVLLRTLLVQPDGKIVVGGAFTQVGSRPLRRLARFLADGTEDVAFTTALGTGFDAGDITVLARQPDGKLLVGGSFGAVNGQARPGLVRLEASGAPDNSFGPPIKPAAEVGYLAVQPDGNILAASGPNYSGGLLTGGSAELVRLTAAGQPDATFVTTLRPRGGTFGHTGVVGVQADGRIVFQGGTGPNAFVTRLLANGTADPAWTQPAYNPVSAAVNAGSVQLLPTGQVLLGGSLPQFGAAWERRANVTLLNADGSYNAAFAPHLLTLGQINDAVVQPDGRILIAGTFSELNDRPALGLARLLPTGAVDTVFTNRSRLYGSGTLTGIEGYRVALQADGNVLVAGNFNQVNGQARPSLARLLPGGGLDNSFAPSVTGPSGQWIGLVVQPDGRILASGLPNNLMRLRPTGAPDASFAPAVSYWTEMPDPLLLPDGTMLVVDNTLTVRKLQATGANDPAFGGIPGSGAAGTFYVRTLVRYPDGRLLAGGYGLPPGGSGNAAVARFSATGAPDASFTATLPANSAPISQLVLQPDGKVLALQGETGTTLRLLPGGQPDPSYDPARLPQYNTRKLVLQPDGALLAVGAFEHQGYFSIARYTGLVTATNTARTLPRPAVWPNPTRGQLHLRPNAPARTITLLDLAGRVVQTQAATAAAEQTLDVRQQPAGAYLLRVEYAQGATATQRVVVE